MNKLYDIEDYDPSLGRWVNIDHVPNIARNLSYDKKGLTVIAPIGFYLTTPNFLSPLGINAEVGVDNPDFFGEDVWNVYYNGTLINKFND